MKKKIQQLKKDLGELLKKAESSIILIYVGVFIVSSLIIGTLLRYVIENIRAVIEGGSWHFRWHLLIEPMTWMIGGLICILIFSIYALNGGFRRLGVRGKGLCGFGDLLQADQLLVNIVQ